MVGVEIQIERGDFDNAQFQILAITVNVNDVFLGGLFFQYHLVAHNGDGASVMLAGAAGGDDFQIDLGTLGPTDLIDHFIQTQADYRYRVFFILGDTHDAVRRL